VSGDSHWVFGTALDAIDILEGVIAAQAMPKFIRSDIGPELWCGA
jgi:hypothetical protein